jgi:hypothetical protein
MSTNVLRKSGGWAALGAGCLEILALISLILFFAVELPQESSSSLRFGYLSDVIPIIAAPLNLAVVGILFLLQRRDSPGLSAIAAILGFTGVLITAWTNIRFVSGEIMLEKQIQLFYISMIFLGSWHILFNSLARQNGLLPSRLATFGVLVGMGQVTMFVSSWILGGYDEMVFSGFDEITQDIRLLASLVIGILLALIGYVCAPIWLVWLGRVLVREDTGMPSGNQLDALQTGGKESMR